ncbi:MAG: response regulator [Actinobacteria bacterium]|nr:response regulator [Actinomycetota bacterium]
MSRIRVLIADDDAALRDALVDLLSTHPDMEVVGAAGDAEEAIALANSHHPDVAILDVRMGGGGGARASRGILESHPKCKVIALSAYHDLPTVLEMLRAGAVGYLVKGVSPENIPQSVVYAFKGEPILSRKVTIEVIAEFVRLLDQSEQLSVELADLDRIKTELVQVLSHELRTPVTIIRGAASTLVKLSGREPELSQELADSIRSASDRISRLASNVSAAASLDRGDTELATAPLAVRDLVGKAAAEFPRDKDRLRLPQDSPLLEEMIWADRELAVRSLVLVLENALEFSPENEPVEVELETGEVQIVTLVRDRGPGIPEEEKERIFERFSQADASTSREHEGLGMSLYLARRIMDAHRGEVNVAARSGGGSTFSLSFPRVLQRETGSTDSI